MDCFVENNQEVDVMVDEIFDFLESPSREDDHNGE